jgi:hypothetical protein
MVEAGRSGDGTWQDEALDRATMNALQTAEAYWIDPRIGRVLRRAADSLPEDTTFGPELFVSHRLVYRVHLAEGLFARLIWRGVWDEFRNWVAAART